MRIDTFRASGAGGQHVNKTDSAVRITHLPTGIVVECQDDRSQHRNRAQAMAVLASRLVDRERRERQQKEAAHRKSLIGSGDRSERIRTYNFPQGRVTDHRINLTLYKIDAIMDGDLDELIGALAQEFQAEQLAALAGRGSVKPAPWLVTLRLALREFIAADADDVHRLDSDPRVVRFIGNGHGRRRAGDRHAVRADPAQLRDLPGPRQLARDAARHRRVRRLVHAQVFPADGDVEVGYRLLHDAWGRASPPRARPSSSATRSTTSDWIESSASRIAATARRSAC